MEKSKEEVEALRVAEGGVPRMSKEEVARRQRKVEGQVAKQKVLMGRLANTTTVEGKKELMEQLRALTAEMEPSLAPDLLVGGAGSNSNASSSSPKPSSGGGGESLSQEEEERQRLDRELTEGRMEGVEESGSGGGAGGGKSSNTAMLLAMLAQKKAEVRLSLSLFLSFSPPTSTSLLQISPSPLSLARASSSFFRRDASASKLTPSPSLPFFSPSFAYLLSRPLS